MQLEKIYSYYKAFKTNAKQRWFYKSLISVFTLEFKKSPLYLKDALINNAILINNKKAGQDYIIKPKDLITHIIHVHEPSAPELPIIYKDSKIIVVNKPSGIACHPTTNYYFYSVTKALEKEYGKLGCINRLDVPTSGVLILTNNKLNFHELMTNRNVKKIYVAKVVGNLQSQTVNSSIKQTDGCYNVISEDGKVCCTDFVNIGYKDGFSLVECKPLTGRSHQIRVHLKSIGHPIEGDILYNENCENNDYHSDYFCDGSVYVEDECDKMVVNMDGKCKKFATMNCEGLNNRIFRNRRSGLCLHAYQYTLNDMTFTAPLPEWAHFINSKKKLNT